MSLVPLRFRNWWDDWDAEFHSSLFGQPPFHASRVIDPHFGLGLNRDDLLSSFWAPTPSLFRNGYLRPWTVPEMKPRLDTGSTVKLDANNFEIIVDVQQFKPNEISVKATDHDVVVEGKHEEHPDEHGHVYRHFVRRYQLPNNVRRTDVTSTLSSDGVLTVTAPLKRIPPPVLNERAVPITSVGPTRNGVAAK